MIQESLTSDTPADCAPLFPVCPGCGGAWTEAGNATACSRCGVDRQEAAWLLWKEVAAPYAAAHEAAREGRFGDARALLRPLLRSPVHSDPIRHLNSLCASVLGECAQDDMPEITHAYAEYAAARRDALMGNTADALASVDHCLSQAPSLLPAQKLLMLLLAGAGRGSEAELTRSAVMALFPAEPDITRWKFTGSPTLRRISRHRRAVPVILQKTTAGEQGGSRQNREGVYALPTALGAVAIAVVSLGLSLKPPPSPPERPAAAAPPAALVGTAPAPPNKKQVLPADFTREWEERRRGADFAQARAWFNRAVRAKSRGDWQECDRFAAAAYHLGKNSYLADESLVLRALAADNRKESTAIRLARYAAIAEETPDSVYVPWALRTAARLAEQNGQTDKAEKYRRRLRLRPLRTGAAREGASRSET